MESFDWVSVGLYWSPDDAWAPYYGEALEHAGIPFTRLESLSAPALAEFDVLLLCGRGALPTNLRDSVASWVQKGGALVSSGSAWNLDAVLGVDEPRHVSQGRVKGKVGERLWPDDFASALFFGGSDCTASSATEALLSSHDRAIATRRRIGKGRAFYFGVHVGQTMCQMQLGRSVEVDGIGAADGSARLDDGILRAEDGTVFDFERDRTALEGSQHVFLYPHADIIKEIWLRAVIEAAESTGKCLPIVWYWPSNAQGAAALTVETKTYYEDRVNRLQRTTSLVGCRPAWLIGMPGFSLDVYRSLRNADQEIGLLFSIEEGLRWVDERMKIQHVALSRAAGVPHMISTRAGEGKWQGWTTFYEMCEPSGARLSLSKGGRQPGTTGFLFGTSHLFFPLKRDGTPFLAAELPYVAHMPGVITPIDTAEALMKQAAAVHGCFQTSIDLDAEGADESIDAVRTVLSLCKQNHFEFMRPDEVYNLERTRRSLRLFPKASEHEGSLTLVSEADVRGLTILFAGQSTAVTIHGRQAELSNAKRFGANLQVLTVNLEGKTQLDLAIVPASSIKAA